MTDTIDIVADGHPRSQCRVMFRLRDESDIFHALQHKLLPVTYPLHVAKRVMDRTLGNAGKRCRFSQTQG